MGNIASINGQDVPSGGASEPTSGVIFLGDGTLSSLALGTGDKTLFSLCEFNGTPLINSQVSKVRLGRYTVGILDTSNNLWLTSGQSPNTGSGSSYGGLTRKFKITLTSVSEFDSGHQHTIAIKTDGTLWAIGNNGDGQFGRGNTTNQYSNFVQIGTDTDWSSVQCGSGFTIALKTDGTLWSAGNNTDGRTGQGTTSGDTISWTQIGTDSDWTSFSCGENWCVGIRDGGKLYAWGDGASAKLGTGTTSDVTTPTLVHSDTDWQSVHCGANYTKAIKTTSGHHYHVGTGGSFGGGTRGDGSTSSLTSWTRIGTDTGWTEFVNLKYSSFSYYAAGKKNGSWYVCGAYDRRPLYKTNGVAHNSNTATFIQLTSPTPTFYGLCQSDGSKPEPLYII